ncbi:hypothetical protein JQK88_07210 [Mesorhizobium caraganae]|uniref:hypothetical protein n=1 Tax=Mesorhizobium caraganae TaxID=483206 RepID=UPI001939CF47|nr:hypothetical protein [Mesorhizobium caraganae]MBM2711038.1 hypothetical protein [Mesorhizobium caraganae]
MIAIRFVAAALALISYAPTAQALDWPAQLHKSPIDLQLALGSSVSCSDTGFSVPVEIVDAETKVQANLLEPVTSYSKAFSLGDISLDRDEHRRFVSKNVELTTCVIGREATATAYSYKGEIFRIAIQYDRCQERREETSFLFKTTEMVCTGADDTEKPFDTTLYREITNIAHGYETDYEWIPSLHEEYAPAEQQLIVSLECDGSDELRRRLYAIEDSKRCLIGVDNTDVKRWSATTMYELYKDGYLSDQVTAHLTASRLFVDLAAEQQAVEAMLPEFQGMISDIQKRIAERLDAKTSNEDAVSDILGTGN